MASHQNQPANSVEGQASVSQPVPPPYYCFSPSDKRVILTFLIPKIRNQLLPLNNIVDNNVFEGTPTELARANGYSEEKPVIYFFTEKYRKTAQWKRNYRRSEVISSGTSIIGDKKKLSYAENRATLTKWFLDEYTTRLEGSDLAVYKLYTGPRPAHGLLLEAAQDLNPAVPLQTGASSSVFAPPSNPLPLVHQASTPGNQQQHHGNLSTALPAYIPQHVNQASSWNPHLLHGSQGNPNPQLQPSSSSLPFPEENTQPGLSSLHFPHVNPNPQLQPGSSSQPLPEEHPQFLHDSGHTDSLQHLNDNTQEDLEFWNQIWQSGQYEELPNDQPTTANTGLEVQQPPSKPLQPTENMDTEGGY